MTVETFDTNTDLITVSETAAEHFRQALAGTGRTAVRISVAESGCTGFKYVMEEVDEPAASDVVLDLSNGVRIFLDNDAVNFLRGTQVDYTQEGLNRTLQFNNPNVTAECGCGESFSVA